MCGMPLRMRHPALFFTRTGQYTSSVFHTDISHPVPNLSLYFIHISYLCLSDRLRISLKIRRSASAESVSSSITSAANKSRDAKSCVSQGGKAFFLSVFTACAYCCGLLGRRKILRLYWADAIKYIRKNQGYYTHSTKVETQNLASHKQGKHLFVSVFIASVYCNGLIGRRKILRLYWADAIKYIRKKQGYYMRSTKVETQNLASHKEERHLFSAYSSHTYIAMD